MSGDPRRAADQIRAGLSYTLAGDDGLPEHIRSDNGTEFIAGKIQRWLHENQIKTLYIEPGSPWQNGYIESFHSRFRDECLNREWLLNLREARVVIEDWQLHYNTERPHSRLDYLSPEDYIKREKVSCDTTTEIYPVGLCCFTPDEGVL